MSGQSDEIPKQYSPTEVEARWYEFWETSGFFSASEDPDDHRQTYTLAIPPPNVTGSLHMGHACRTTFEDVLCRHKRMQGYNTLWVPGIDHAARGFKWLVMAYVRMTMRFRILKFRPPQQG